MKIDTAEFLSAIDGPVTLSSKRSTMPELSYIKLSASGGKLVTAGTTLDIYQETITECAGDIEPVCAPGVRLRDALKGFSGDVEVEVANKRITLSGTHNIRLASMPAEKFVAAPSLIGTPVDVDAAELSVAIKSVAWCASVDHARPNLQGVSIRENGVCATDGYCLSVAEIASNVPKPGIFIPSNGIAMACSSLSLDGAKLIDGENHIIITHTSERTWIKKSTDGFPNYRDIFSPENKLIGTLDSDAFKQILSLAASLYDDTFAYTKIEFTPTECIVSQGSAASDMRSTFSGEFKPLKFAANATRLVRSVSHFDGTVEVWGRDNLSPLLLKGSNLRTVILGLRWQE